MWPLCFVQPDTPSLPTASGVWVFNNGTFMCPSPHSALWHIAGSSRQSFPPTHSTKVCSFRSCDIFAFMVPRCSFKKKPAEVHIYYTIYDIVAKRFPCVLYQISRSTLYLWHERWNIVETVEAWNWTEAFDFSTTQSRLSTLTRPVTWALAQALPQHSPVSPMPCPVKTGMK